MKKSKLSIGLVTSFIATMALSACSASVTKNKNDIVTFKGYDGEQDISVSIDEIYEDYMKSSAGISKYYDQVIEVLIRNAFQNDKRAEKEYGQGGLKDIKKNYQQILNEAKDNVKGAKAQAKENAETNGTSYKTEWQSVLNEKGVKDEEELLQYYVYRLEKEEIEDFYFEKNKVELKCEYLGVKTDGTDSTKYFNYEGKQIPTASSRLPYHIRHILIKVEDGGSNYVRGTISSSQAKLLSSTVELLAQGTMNFGEVAQKKSEDTSASSYGDVGIMTNAISGGKLGMVNEFQLGIYAYDAIIKRGTTSNAVIDKGLALGKKTDTDSTKTVKEYFTDRGVVEIPYSAFKELGDVADLENNYATGLPVLEGKTDLYPRNLLWNRYFNNHGIFVITNGSRYADASFDKDTGAADIKEAHDKTSSATYYGTGVDAYNKKYDGTAVEINYADLKGFNKVAGFDGENERILTTNEKNPKVIIGVRSEYGIHLMLVEKSIYDYNSTVDLEKYYTTYIPSDDEYPEIPADEHTYVDFIQSNNNSEYNTRAEAVKSAIKGFDSTYDYRLYEWLTATNGIRDIEKNKEILELIDEYIKLQREKNAQAQEDGMIDVWNTYIDLLETQDFYRNTLSDRIVPEGCKIAFTKDLTAEQKKELEAAYKEGGACYVK